MNPLNVCVAGAHKISLLAMPQVQLARRTFNASIVFHVPLRELCQAKVAELHIPPRIIEHVVRFDVAVDDAARVQVGQRSKKLPRDAPPLVVLQGARLQLPPQRRRAELHLDVQHFKGLALQCTK